MPDEFLLRLVYANYEPMYVSTALSFIVRIIKGEIVRNKNLQQKLLTWIFYFLSVGMLVSGGIYIEKIILTKAALADILKALIFCLVGVGTSAYCFFTSRRKI
jgi:hypothetical protein